MFFFFFFVTLTALRKAVKFHNPKVPFSLGCMCSRQMMCKKVKQLMYRPRTMYFHSSEPTYSLLGRILDYLQEKSQYSRAVIDLKAFVRFKRSAMAAGLFRAEMSMLLSSTLARTHSFPFRKTLKAFDPRIAMQRNPLPRTRRSRVSAFSSSSPSHPQNFPVPGQISDIGLL